jgi:hypothetical protein
MGVSTIRKKDAADIGILQVVTNLHTQKAKADVPDAPKIEHGFEARGACRRRSDRSCHNAIVV